MFRIIIAVVFALFASAAIADTIRIDNRIITTGMSLAEVIDRAGQPSRTVQLQNVYGAGVGERWEYYRKSKQYNVWVSGGKVIKVDES